MLSRLMDASPDRARDALRRALQSAVAAVTTYVLMHALETGEVYLAILAAVLIIQPSIGGTMGAALTRLQATVAGSFMGLACLAILPESWSTAAALGMSMLVVGGAAGLRSDWSYGAVAAVAIALAPAGDVLATAWARGLAIAMGAGVGVLVSLLVLPDRAEARFERHLRSALHATARRFADAVEATMKPGHEVAPADHVSTYHNAVRLAQEALDATKLVDRAGMARRLHALRQLYNSVIILDQAAEAYMPPIAGAETLRDQVDLLRRDTCMVLTSLADGANQYGDQLEEMDTALEKLRRALAEDDPASYLHRSRNAVAFGLHEVRRALARLIEASSQTA